MVIPVFYLLHGEEYNSNGIYFKSYDFEELVDKTKQKRLQVVCRRCNGRDECTAFKFPFDYVKPNGTITASNRKGVNFISGLHFEKQHPVKGMVIWAAPEEH